jgi:hypothetical protein
MSRAFRSNVVDLSLCAEQPSDRTMIRELQTPQLERRPKGSGPTVCGATAGRRCSRSQISGGTDDAQDRFHRGAHGMKKVRSDNA